MKVQGYEGYTIYEDGRIEGPRGKLLKPEMTKSGYPRVSLCKGGKVERFQLHRLVAQHFLPPPEDGKTIVHHLDNNRGNPHKDNLAWVTPSENVKAGFDAGRKVAWAFTEELVEQVIKFRLAGNETKATVEEFGIGRTSVQRIMRRYRDERT